MSELLLERKAHVLRISFNRPDLHNSFHPGLIKELSNFFKTEAVDPYIRAVVIEGEGPSFSAGADLEWMRDMVKFTVEANEKDAGELFEMYETIANCPTPLIAKVHGNVIGGGLGLAAVADIVLAEFDTKFCFSEVRLGIAPAVISSFVLRKMNPGMARDLMLTGRFFDAQTAQASGLVQFVGRELEMEQQLEIYLEYFRKAGSSAVRETKSLLNSYKGMNPSQMKAASTKLIAKLRTGIEGQEGIKAFLEKRKPNWTVENGEKD